MIHLHGESSIKDDSELLLAFIMCKVLSNSESYEKLNMSLIEKHDGKDVTEWTNAN